MLKKFCVLKLVNYLSITVIFICALGEELRPNLLNSNLTTRNFEVNLDYIEV